MLLVLAAMLGVIAYVRWNVIQTRPNHAELGIGDSGGRDVDVVDSELGLDKALSAKRHSEMEAEFNTLKYGSAKPEEAEEEEQREAEEIAKPSTATSPAAKLSSKRGCTRCQNGAWLTHVSCHCMMLFAICVVKGCQRAEQL